MTQFVNDIRQFMQAVGHTTNAFNVSQTALYEGFCLEESAEALHAIFAPTALMLADGKLAKGGEDHMAALILADLYDQIERVSGMMKAGTFDCLFKHADRLELLDSAIDRAWVALGSAYSQGADVPGACAEVSRSNISKLVTCDECHGHGYIDGVPCEKCDTLGLIAIKDENGKVKKPDGWGIDLLPHMNTGEPTGFREQVALPSPVLTIGVDTSEPTEQQSEQPTEQNT